MKPKRSRTYAFDFDGVVTHYAGFRGPEHIDPPNKEVIKAVRMLKEQGHKILIYSTRGTAFLKSYCRKHNISVDYFNDNPNIRGHNKGKPIAHVYVDDRAILYKGQKAETLVQQLNKFKAYWQ